MIGRVTRIVLTVAIVALAAWATVAAVLGGPGDTISEYVRDYASAYPIIPFAGGVLVGHWWWSMGPAVRRSETPAASEP